MIESLQDFPKGVVAFTGKGQITKQDYETVLIPSVEEALKQAGKLRLYYQIGPDFSGMEAGAILGRFQGGRGAPVALGTHRLGHRRRLDPARHSRLCVHGSRHREAIFAKRRGPRRASGSPRAWGGQPALAARAGWRGSL